MPRVRRVVVVVAWLGAAACTASSEPGPEPGGGVVVVDPGPDPVPGGPIEVTLTGLEPGWVVTTSRLTDGSAPSDTTQISDGSPLALTGAANDVFVATITDGHGALVATQSMRQPCTLAGSRQLHVPGEFPTIQAAIDVARAGDTVAVAAGRYTESVTLRPGGCLVGSGAQTTVLDAGGEPRSLIDLTDAPGSMVAGFTLRGVTRPSACGSEDLFDCSGNWFAAGIYLAGTRWSDPTQFAPPLIIGNTFEDNDIGVLLWWRGVAVVRNNVFTGNRSGLVANHFQSRTLIANNVFHGNTALAIGNQAAYLDIVENVIAGSQVGVRFMFVQTGFIRCNRFFENGADASEPRFEIGKDGNTSGDPGFVDPAAGDFHLAMDSAAVDAGCTGGVEPDGSPHDLGAFGGPLAAWAER